MPRRAESAPRVVRGLPTPGDPRFRLLRSRKEIEQLRQVLYGAESELSPESAADALSRSPEGIKVLREALGSELPAGTRRAAVYGFVWVKKPTTADVKRLLRIYRDRAEPPDIRGQAAEALGPCVAPRRKAGRAQQRDARALARDALVWGLDDAEAEVRLWSIFALASPENEWLLPKLESMVEDRALVPGMYTVGQEARWAIRRIRREEDIDPEEL